MWRPCERRPEVLGATGVAARGTRDLRWDEQPIHHGGGPMPGTKRHGPSIKNPEQYEGLREEGMSKQRAAAISNANANNNNDSSRKGGRNSHKND
jgi:hypothetical protein